MRHFVPAISLAPKVALLGLAMLLAGCAGDGAPSVSQSSPLAGSADTGGPILAGLNADDRQKADAARQQALEHGAAGTAFTWKSAESMMRYGSVVAGPTYTQGGQNCRQFTQTIYIDGVPQTARSAACRQSDGNWRGAA